ncbi:PD40 domain-containing protein [Umezawaea tangerina]|uniref:WD40 repeat protein n=1 Tax=Umezawaea tangerina TaxID=84725 RepID=A0A2T0T508_9PSEU|nr:PD40 domain-containing protein [Umezawaea tangerina]PRY40714.1 WD40 repeat protein [Umezawaea tangerina]
MTTRTRTALGALLIVVVVLATGVYLWQAGGPSGTAAAAAPGGASITLVDQRDGGDAVSTTDPGQTDGPRTPTGLRCQRVYTAGGTTVCLRLAGIGPSFEAAVIVGGAEVKTIPLPGVPSRARVSASGKVVSWTVFVTGDSYASAGGFSTRTGYYDLRDGTLVESLETFALTVDGVAHTALDVNYWGMTFQTDDTTFYATVGTGGRRWLIKGSTSAKTAATVRQGPECPSLSPDGKHLAYKKATKWVGRWELAVEDLETGTEKVLPNTSGIDDQAAWLDDNTLAYGVPSQQTGVPGIYRVQSNGTTDPILIATAASSPVPNR